MTLPITSLLAGAFALLMAPLSLLVSLRRLKLGNAPPGGLPEDVLHLLHAFGMLYASTPPVRAGAMLIQHAALVVAGCWLVSAAIA